MPSLATKGRRGEDLAHWLLTSTTGVWCFSSSTSKRRGEKMSPCRAFSGAITYWRNPRRTCMRACMQVGLVGCALVANSSLGTHGQG
jgi:hypothetical protein